ncbi:hypothetical protein DFH08DRAFT_806201 [Mycena albidolilacea]|uniref:Uncharacterized protein n=1 Tax=Mycena albidolilacea TaxID=1033008 RepID=A0AAD7A7U2_9AGAR|nr:hypothetical protein DFH08DRAFT_806201 [Mycena albidolilacea]
MIKHRRHWDYWLDLLSSTRVAAYFSFRCLSSCSRSPSGGGLSVVPSVDLESTGLVSLVRGIPAYESSHPSAPCPRSLSFSRSRSRSRSCPCIPPLHTPIHQTTPPPPPSAAAPRPQDSSAPRAWRVEPFPTGAEPSLNGSICVRGDQRALDNEAAHDVLKDEEEDGAQIPDVRVVRGFGKGVVGGGGVGGPGCGSGVAGVGADAAEVGRVEDAGMGIAILPPLPVGDPTDPTVNTDPHRPARTQEARVLATALRPAPSNAGQSLAAADPGPPPQSNTCIQAQADPMHSTLNWAREDAGKHEPVVLGACEVEASRLRDRIPRMSTTAGRKNNTKYSTRRADATVAPRSASVLDPASPSPLGFILGPIRLEASFSQSVARTAQLSAARADLLVLSSLLDRTQSDIDFDFNDHPFKSQRGARETRAASILAKLYHLDQFVAVSGTQSGTAGLTTHLFPPPSVRGLRPKSQHDARESAMLHRYGAPGSALLKFEWNWRPALGPPMPPDVHGDPHLDFMSLRIGQYPGILEAPYILHLITDEKTKDTNPESLLTVNDARISLQIFRKLSKSLLQQPASCQYSPPVELALIVRRVVWQHSRARLPWNGDSVLLQYLRVGLDERLDTVQLSVFPRASKQLTTVCGSFPHDMVDMSTVVQGNSMKARQHNAEHSPLLFWVEIAKERPLAENNGADGGRVADDNGARSLMKDQDVMSQSTTDTEKSQQIFRPRAQ